MAVRSCVAFKTRPATKDVDAIFEPVREIRNAAHRIADIYDLDIDWLNLAVKMFIVEHKKEVLYDLSNLKVYVPDGDYLLAMKLLSARADTEDFNDIRFLIDHLDIKTVEQAHKIVRNYYPQKSVAAETVFFLEEVLGK